jgi:ABC-2 type transport system permease protein
MKNTIWLTSNMLKRILKRKSGLFLLFGLPVVSVFFVLLIYGHNGTSALRLGIVDNDNSTLSHEYIKALESNDKFKLYSLKEMEIDKKITTSKVDCALIIQAGFENGIYQGDFKSPEVKSIKGESSTALLSSFSNVYLQNLINIAKASDGNKKIFARIYTNLMHSKNTVKTSTIVDETKGKVVTTQAIGFVIMFIMMGSSTLAELILSEKRARTYFRICSAPVSSRSFVIGNAISDFIIVIAQAVLTIILMTKVLNIQTYMKFWEMLIIMTMFGLVSVSIGILIAAFSKDSRQSNALAILIISPTSMLAGCMFPFEVMPKNMQKIAEFLPQRWTLAAIQKLQETGNFNSILSYLGIILAFAVTFFVVAAYRFSKNDDVRTFV